MLNFSLLALAILIGCSSGGTMKQEPTQAKQPMLLGWTNRSEIQSPKYHWFDSVYSAYEQKTEMLRENAPLLNDIEITVVFGTWCSDSRRELPRFFRIMDELKFPEEKIHLCAIDRKKGSTDSLRSTFNIELVPTFIVRRNSTEIGRIIESPKTSLEVDLFEILISSPP